MEGMEEICMKDNDTQTQTYRGKHIVYTEKKRKEHGDVTKKEKIQREVHEGERSIK